MLFGRGQWAVFAVDPNSLAKFKTKFAEVPALSQLAASVITKFDNISSAGINPYNFPRKDELIEDVAVLKEVHEGTFSRATAGYGTTVEEFEIGDKTYGFWMVFNEYQDNTDVASRKEAAAYDLVNIPFKFLPKETKKTVEDQVLANSTPVRRQFPVIVDFQHGRVYAASSATEDITAVNDILTELGATTSGLHWVFGSVNWPSEFLNHVRKNTKFVEEMKERAEDLSRFHKDEIVKLDDKTMEKIVSTFFAISELGSGMWAGLTTPARIKLHREGDPASTSSPSVAFDLLNYSKDSEVATASVVFQDLITKETKNGEKVIRKDIFTIDINNNINNQDAGAALLRGFDLPQFKRDLKKLLKTKEQVDIKDFWYEWLNGMDAAILLLTDNITDALNLTKSEAGLRPYEDVAVMEEVVAQ